MSRKLIECLWAGLFISLISNVTLCHSKSDEMNLSSRPGIYFYGISTYFFAVRVIYIRIN